MPNGASHLYVRLKNRPASVWPRLLGNYFWRKGCKRQGWTECLRVREEWCLTGILYQCALCKWNSWKTLILSGPSFYWQLEFFSTLTPSQPNISLRLDRKLMSPKSICHTRTESQMIHTNVMIPKWLLARFPLLLRRFSSSWDIVLCEEKTRKRPLLRKRFLYRKSNRSVGNEDYDIPLLTSSNLSTPHHWAAHPDSIVWLGRSAVALSLHPSSGSVSAASSQGCRSCCLIPDRLTLVWCDHR